MNELGPVFGHVKDIGEYSPGIVEGYYLKNFPVRKGGFFVECGAGNGLIQSNSLHLEREHGWSGLLIESHDLLFAELIRHRPGEAVRCVHETVGTSGKAVLFDEIVYDGTPRSEYLGWSSMAKKRGRFSKDKISRSMTEILEQYQAPEFIDFCVIDVESTFAEVIGSLDLNRFKIQVLAAEMSPFWEYQPTVDHILSHGYELRHIIPRGPDYVFVKKES